MANKRILDERIVMDEKVNLFEETLTLKEQLELSEGLKDFFEMYLNEFYDEVGEETKAVDNLCRNLSGLYRITRKLVHRANAETNEVSQMANIYNFELGKINDELVEEYKELIFKYGKRLTNQNTIGSKIARGELELTDDIVFQSAICFAKDYLKEVLQNE